ncbi:MAG: 50S ribosomal protein L10 [Desulfatiglans sp.]|jgi:large subunit ribosomal protein L10|nr:50S ribosomal protein L10 [Thermodesulfobacteriota bacterium]MEE4352762.1 50S ribosomal protein L10 [Desulfatiglans sp.]
MDKKQKQELVSDLHGRLERAEGVFLMEYKGLDVESTNKLRRELRNANAEFQVVKNRLLKIASRDTDTAQLDNHMQGPTAIAITYDELVGPAKVLTGFSKEFKKLVIKGGQISGKVMDPAAVKRLAELPAKDVLLAQTLAVMQAVPASFVRTLSGVIGKLLNVLKAIENKKEESS